MKFKRHHVPVLTPNPDNAWEALNVFNPAVIYHNGLFHMHYRAQGHDYVSRIGYAVSEDGVNWNRLQRPVLCPSGDLDARGVEDPRVTALDGRFYMAYTAFDRSSPFPKVGETPKGITPMFAVSDNLITWERLGPLVRGEDNKDHALFPRKVCGRYVSFHRRPPSIWLAFSDDLKVWGDHAEILRPRPGLWDGKRVGAGGPPIETEAGWLMIYHGYDDEHVYCMGTALLDLEDPRRVLKRPKETVLEPNAPWERRGDVPNVVFGCANPVVNGTVYLFYGGADRVVGLATADLNELLAWTLEHG
ncbi:glycoside hydrolase family 130 protein [Truepera radiovictrix]|uniref:Glycosidase-related protein n=1 Tax=Truepera radiovictrix (strain DSM 17093 / CIP 108686 / LMG 22925 / RQ-24) TaxID=649638 RepID=D7CQF8_TRURR|nr:glycosidase [Truepera radiovictrix]ADI14942.1 glycosidase-related protein [Truepera radiovictrix DSM 17093]WMT56502.1 glycosidase [Truepera radiovictrix]